VSNERKIDVFRRERQRAWAGSNTNGGMSPDKNGPPPQTEPKFRSSDVAQFSSRTLTENEHEERVLMANLGLPDFETWEQCAERQKQMVRRLQNVDRRRSQNFDWPHCGPDACACSPCLDGCWFSSRRHRYQMITEAQRLFSTQKTVLHFVSVAHPKWELPVGNLNQANIKAVQQWLYRRLKQLGTTVVAVGGFEVSLNVDLDGTSCWAGHVHLVIAGSDKPTLKKALQIEKHYRSRPHSRPVDVRDVDNLGRRLGYSLKRIARRRVAYIDDQGRQNRNQVNLHSSDQREFDAWLLGLRVGDRTILIGCRAHGNQLRLVNGYEQHPKT
jgi:hypothetical protein